MPKGPVILILTNREDITADYVVLELQKRGVHYFRFNVEDFPQKVVGTVSLAGATPSALFQTPKGIVDVSALRSIWYRRPGHPSLSRDLTDEGVREFCLRECDEFLQGVWANFGGLWVSYPPSIFHAQNKLYQLRVAKDLGFDIPDTLVTSDQDAVRQFVERAGCTVIVKAVRQGALTIGGRQHVIFTSPIQAEDLEYLSGLRYAPSIFQKYIPKRFDLRVTVIGRAVFPVEIHAGGADADARFDWRRADQEALVYRVHDLPPRIVRLCRAIVRKMRLSFGAMDLICSAEGGYYFLEINPNGQWAWIQQRTGLKLTEALVDLLVGGGP